MGRRYKHKKKTLKSTSTRDIAKKALKIAKTEQKQEEHKWKDFTIEGQRLRNYVGYTSSATMSLTEIGPLFNPSAAATMISSYNKRLGAKIHISGVYLNVQFSWPTIQSSSAQRYPPFACIKYALVRQKKSELAVEGGNPALSAVPPIPGNVYQLLNAASYTSAVSQPITCMLFKNMQNGHNYDVLAEGTVILPGPVVNCTAPGELTMQPSSTTNYVLGECANNLSASAAPDTTISQFSNNVVRNVEIRVNPNVNARYKPTADGVAQSNIYEQALENGIYFMAWTDQANLATSLARFQPPAAAPYIYEGPLMWVNARIRFTDA